MSVGAMLVTEPDMLKLADLLEGGRRWPVVNGGHTRALRRKLARAGVVRADEVPADVITLHSRVRVRHLDTGNDSTYVLVMPAQASAAAGTISVLSPVGAALLGCRQGDEIEYPVPGGRRRLKIEQMLYQPEAAAHRSTPADARAADGPARQQPNGGLSRPASLVP